MPGVWVSDLRDHLGLSQNSQRWQDLQDLMREVIKTYFELLPSAPVASRQQNAMKKTIEQIFQDQGHYFPPNRHSQDAFLLRRYIIERVSALRRNLRNRLQKQKQNKQSSIKLRPERRKAKASVRFKVPETPLEINPTFTMTLRSRVKQGAHNHNVPQNAPSDAERNPGPISNRNAPSARYPPRNPLYVFQQSKKSDKFVPVPVTPSKLRSASWRPISQRIHTLHDSITRNIAVRTPSRAPSQRRSWYEGSLTPLSSLDGNEHPRTQTRTPTPAPPRKRPNSRIQSHFSRNFSPAIPSLLSQVETGAERDAQSYRRATVPLPTNTPSLSDVRSNGATYAASSIRLSPPMDEFLNFLESGSLSHLYPYLKREGYNMGVVEKLSHYDFNVINLVIEQAAKKIAIPSGDGSWQYKEEGTTDTGFEPVNWQLLAAKIYQFGQDRKDRR
ncbi:hypothetical protein BDN72DRAFT_964170 [Pluteus cervinus]|uniref:Uncharacterized protein n=1 Tax=Pluteus cervinus TaxID=181527 RepID=A0ACD3ADZ6_9AGAR|nr:hypothetical protein BDN72DRAFT_964170 [Pluteus cervinus]